MTDFIKTFTPDGASYEINNLKVVLPKDTVDGENIYFLGGVKEGLDKRASDDDIIMKNYFVIDLDLRNAYEKMNGKKCDTESILEEAKAIKEYLNEDSEWKKWRYIVFTGNGIHIYYVGKTLIVGKDIDKKTYAYGVNKIYNEFKEYFNTEWIVPDFACKNIGRITRLPGTINMKNGEICRILYENSAISEKIGILKELGTNEILKEKQNEEKERQKYLDEQKKRIEQYGEDGNFYEIICKEFPAFVLAEEMNGFKLAPNGKNFLNEKGGYCGYWYDKENNIIHNGGSTHYFLNHSGYSPFMILKEWKNLTNKETFNYFTKIFRNARSKDNKAI